MRYSVLIRTKNSESTLGDTLKALDGQTLRAREVLVLDSGSEDGTLDIARRHGCRVELYPNDRAFNYSESLNQGFEYLDTPYVLVLSSHVQLYRNDTCEKLIYILEQHDAAVASYCSHYQRHLFDRLSPDEVPDFACSFISRLNFNGGNGLANTSSMIRMSAWKGQCFDVSLPSCEDQVWAYRYYLRGRPTIRLDAHPSVYNNPRISSYKLARDRYVKGRTCYGKYLEPRELLLYFFKAFAAPKGKKSVRFGAALRLIWYVLNSRSVSSFNSIY